MIAMVLCAGHGTRLGDLTRDIPKPMLPIQGKPLLEYTLLYLARHGFERVVINLHFMPEKIQAHFGDGSRLGVQIDYSYEETLLGTAGGPRRAADILSQSDSFLLLYGDLLIDHDLSAMVAFHREKHAMATLLVHQRLRSNSLVAMDEANRITAFIERPTEEQRAQNPLPWVNSGVYLLRSEILDRIPPEQPCDFPRDIFPHLVVSDACYGFPLSGYRCAIDSPARYEEAQAAVAAGRYRSPL
jgi:NDP-sugar pyrophosphorylase family protein